VFTYSFLLLQMERNVSDLLNQPAAVTLVPPSLGRINLRHHATGKAFRDLLFPMRINSLCGEHNALNAHFA